MGTETFQTISIFLSFSLKLIEFSVLQEKQSGKKTKEENSFLINSNVNDIEISRAK